VNLRDRYAIPTDDDGHEVVELRAFTHGLMPQTVPAMMERFCRDWQERGVDAWNAVETRWVGGETNEDGEDGETGWWRLPELLGDRFVAPLLGAPAGTCLWQPSVHHAVQHLLSAPEVFAEDRREVVVTENAFPSVLHSVQRWKDLLGLSLTVVPAGADGFVDRKAVLDTLGPETAMVALSHVGFTTGERLPDSFLKKVAARTHRVGGLFVLDGYHAAASMPVQVEELGADLYLGGLLKEGSGSAGNAFVYVREGLELTPRLTGWFGNAAPFAFQQRPEPHPDVRRRFLGGTTPVASMYHAVEGVRILLEAGLDAVRADSLEKTARGIARAEAAGLPLRSPRAAEQRGAMLILEVEAADRLCAWLKARGVYTDSRQGRFLRMAPFVWNSEAEVERAFDLVAEADRTGAHHKAPLPETGGPVT
jgi:kynureninase